MKKDKSKFSIRKPRKAFLLNGGNSNKSKRQNRSRKGEKRKIIMHEANTIHEAAKAIWGSDIQEEKGSSQAFVTSYSSFPSI